MKHTHLPAAEIEPRPRYAQRAESQSVSETSCMARKAGYRDNTLRINTLRERALKAFRSAGLREDESERALDERDQNTGGKARQTGLEGAVGSHARFPAHNSVPQRAHVMSTDDPNTLTTLSLLEVSLNTGPPKNLLRLGSAVHEIPCFHGRQLIFTPPVHVYAPFHGWKPVGDGMTHEAEHKKRQHHADDA